MKRFIPACMALTASLLASSADCAAAPVIDCPLRDAPFSIESPFVDILLSPAARAVIDKAAPARLDKMPAQLASPTPPTFAAILSVRETGMFTGIKPEALPAIDAELRALPVTAADKVARCVSYDNERPTFDLPAGKPHLLLFEKINGFKDEPSVNAAHAAFLAMAREQRLGHRSDRQGRCVQSGDAAPVRRRDLEQHQRRCPDAEPTSRLPALDGTGWRLRRGARHRG